MKQINGIWLPDNDTHFAKHLERGPSFEGCGTYQYSKICAALTYVPENRRRLALDVGAHVGLWTRVLAREFEHVEAFEPVPELLCCFDLNTAHLHNVQVWPCAISDSDGSLQLSEPKGNSGNWHARSRGEKTKHEVRCLQLDSLPRIFGDIDFIKIDVEGWELPVICGAEKTIKTDKPVIIIEQKPGNAERYGFGRYAAAELLEKWGARRLWERSGDIIYGWQD